MLRTLVRFSIRFSGVIIALVLILLIYGSDRFSKAGLDIFPEFAPKQVIIQTEATGLSAEQVEQQVTQIIETSLSGLMGLKSVRSESIQGLSVVTAIFNEDSNIYINRQQVSERLTQIAGKLPPGVAAPTPVPLSSSSATLMTIGLQSDSQNMMDLRTLADWTLIPRIMAVPGVADVNIFGGDVRQLQIQPDPIKLQRFNLSMIDIVNASKGLGKMTGGGFIENRNQRFTLTVQRQQSLEQVRQLIIKRENGNNITLAQVATIKYAPQAAYSAAQIMGKPGIVMMIIGQYGANTLAVSRQIETVLDEFEPLFSKQNIHFYPRLFRPADYIETSLNNLSGHLMLGAFFVLIILFLFLFNIRTALISAIAIPVSLVGALLVLIESGIQLNIMVLGGLAIALGEVVDDAIIDCENIYRRLRENKNTARPQSRFSVIFNASMEVRSSVVYASFIVVLAFVPLLTLSGIAGRLFSPLGVSYILAILMSLLVALTLTPALCFLFLNEKSVNPEEPVFILWLKSLYVKIMTWVDRFFTGTILASIILCLLALLAISRAEHKFLPELREGHFIVHTSSIPGTSLKESIRTGQLLTRKFLDIEGVESVSQWAGRAERGADTYGSHYSEYEIRLKPLSGSAQQQVLEQLRRILDEYPGMVFEANTFLTERIDETISGYTSPVVVNIYGHDLNDLDRKAGEIAAIMQTIQGVEDIQVRSPAGTPQLEIIPDITRLKRFGLTPADVIETVDIAYQGKVVAQTTYHARPLDIAVSLSESDRQDPAYLRQLPLKTQEGGLIQLGQVAEIRQSQSRYNILHQNAQRKQTITCNVDDRDMDDFIQELKEKIFKQIKFEADSYPEFTGAALEQSQARSELILHAVMAGTGILIFIYIAMGNLRNMLLTLCNLPFALLGGAAAVILTGASLSVGSMVGFITLFGITVRNSIMLISHYQYLVSHEASPWNFATVLRGAQERLPSILMTALVTALAMFPIAFNSDNPGREIMGPMAAIIIGGLASSTFLNLFLLPAILLRFGRFNR